MRQSVYSLILAVCLSFLGFSMASAAPVGNAVAVSPAAQELLQNAGYDSYCRNLRYRCENKEELGEEGEGNCRRYRRECGWQRRSYCENLRYRCENKEDLGEYGQGNCRRYRRECLSRHYNNYDE